MSKLFENLKFLILESLELKDDELDEIKSHLDQNQAQYKVKSIHNKITEEEIITNEYTHIVSNTINFPLYNFTYEKLIPVVTSSFIHKTIELNKQPAFRPFSPNPNHVLKDVHICVGGLPDSDKETIYCCVRALGGAFSEYLNKYVTHLISIDTDEDCCIAVNSLIDCKIRIVLPHWIDDCMKLRKRVDDQPYLLQSHESSEEHVKKLKELDVIEKHHSDIVAQKKFLNKKSFYLGSDLKLTENSKSLVGTLIENSGGRITDIFEEAQVYLGKYREGEEYVNASKKELYVGNLNWLYWMIEHQKWISPFKKLLHYPYVQNGLPGMSDFIISSTNYSGDARFYIKKLVEALGAKFTTSLKHENTHLIAATTKGKKYTHALKWDIKVINHLWLEESYSKWRIQPVNHGRYSHYPRSLSLNDIIGETQLDIESLKAFYDTELSSNSIEGSDDEDVTELVAYQATGKGRLVEESIVNSEPVVSIGTISKVENPSIESKDEILEDSTSKPTEVKIIATPSKSPATAKQTPSRTPLNRALDDLSTNTIRLPSGRKAKDKAAAKLHEDMEQLNYFQRQQKSKEIPLLPEEIEERKRKRESERIEKADRDNKRTPSIEPEDIVPQQSAKKPKKSVTPSTIYNIEAIATGWENDFSKSDIQILSNLGIHIHKDFRPNINAIISPKFMRTEKFLTGLSYRLDYIISPLFLKDVVKILKDTPDDLSKLPDVDDYSIDKLNRKSVKELTNLNLKTLMERCREKIDNGERLFNGLIFNISSKLPGGATTVTKILKAHGAQQVHVVKTIKELKTLKSLKVSKEEALYFISNEKGLTERVTTLLEEANETKLIQKGIIIEWDWVIASIFSMSLDHGKHVTFSI